MWGSLFLSCERTSGRKGGGAGGAVVEKFVFCPGAVVGRARRAVCLMIVECDRIVERVIYFWRRRGDHSRESSRANQSIRPQSAVECADGSGAVWRPRSAHVTVRSGRSKIVVHVHVASRGRLAGRAATGTRPIAGTVLRVFFIFDTTWNVWRLVQRHRFQDFSLPNSDTTVRTLSARVARHLG